VKQSISDAIRVIEDASHAFAGIDALAIPSDSPSDDDALADVTRLVDLCRDTNHAITYILHKAETLQGELRKRVRTVNEMVTVIVREMERTDPMRTSKRATTKEIYAGGGKAQALKQAGGRCEVCGAEFDLTPHHIIARAEGGLPDAENMIVLCKPCHDSVEPMGYHTRAEVLRHDPSRTIPLAPRRATREAEEERDAKQTAKLKEQEDVDKWAEQFPDPAGHIYRLGEPEQERPVKSWHVIVYGSGRHSRLAQESEDAFRRSQKADKTGVT
jgi:5-methylcytosine-specific restriction endonuclease McrA